MKRLLLAVLLFSTSAVADSWREPLELVEWRFKLGAVSVALENCPFAQGLRYRELKTNAGSITPRRKVRSYNEGREFMLILDGPDKSVLCGTAFKFFGPGGKDLAGVLAIKGPQDNR